ncbi:unnamed protein product, partial [marine sediment metagenome]
MAETLGKRASERMRTAIRLTVVLLAVLALVAVLAGTLLAQQQREFSFAVFGDCRPGSEHPYSPVLERLASDIGDLAPAFVIGTGDYIEGSTNQRRVRWEFNQF